jgi:hypothetical protein
MIVTGDAYVSCAWDGVLFFLMNIIDFPLQQNFHSARQFIFSRRQFKNNSKLYDALLYFLCIQTTLMIDWDTDVSITGFGSRISETGAELSFAVWIRPTDLM